MARQKSAVVQHAYLFIADSNCEELELWALLRTEESTYVS